MSDYVIDCKEVSEAALVGSAIKDAVKWALDMISAGRKTMVIMGEPGSGKTTALLLIMRRLRELGIPVTYINAYNELGLRPVKLVNCANDVNAKVLLVDDVDAVFTVPRIAWRFIDKALAFDGTIIMTLTIPLLVGNDLEPLEKLIKVLHSSPKFSITYRDDELRLFAQRIGATYSVATMKTPGLILKSFRKAGGGSLISDVMRDSDVVL